MLTGTVLIGAGILYFARTLSNYANQADHLIKKQQAIAELEAAVDDGPAEKDCLDSFLP